MAGAKNQESQICRAALRLAGKHGWQSLTLEQTAKAAKISSAALRQKFSDKNLLLPAIACYVDAQAAPALRKITAQGTPHDRLFEALMARFDVLQDERAGFLALARAVKADPGLARLLLPAQFRAMESTLAALRLTPQNPVHNSLAAVGLLGAYYWALARWAKDDTNDLARTMAALDQALKRAKTVAEIIFRQP